MSRTRGAVAGVRPRSSKLSFPFSVTSILPWPESGHGPSEFVMNQPISELPAGAADLLNLGILLGENQAFALMVGRCSAAQATTLRRLREEGKYKSVIPQWKEFCSTYLKISGTQANQIIQLLEEFGPGYFELAQLTRISAETYRAIAPSIKDGALHLNGDA